MRILVIAPRLPHQRAISGSQIVYQRVARLIRKGHEVGVASFMNGADRYNEEKGFAPEGLFESHYFDEPRKVRSRSKFKQYGPQTEAGSFYRYQDPKMKRTIGDIVRHGRYDVILAEYSAMGQYIYKNPYLPAVRKVISCHESATLNHARNLELLNIGFHRASDFLLYQYAHKREFRYYAAADRVITLTPHEKYGLLANNPDLEIEVIPSGVDIELFKPDPTIKKEEAIVFVGRFNNEQNQDAVRWFINQVWPQLRQRRPGLSFYLVGRNPTPEINHMVEKDNQLRLHADVESVMPFLHKAKAFVCPIRSGSGLRGKVLEAMACALPVVSTWSGVEGIPVHMGRTGLIGDTPEFMINHIEVLLDDPALRNQMGNAAREMVATRFNWSHSADLLEEVLKDVTTRKRYDYFGRNVRH